MKKILLLILTFIIFVPTVFAGTAYVNSMNINANITESGDMVVTENIMYKIDGDLNGTYRDIIIESDNKLSSATDIEILSVEVDGRIYTYSGLTLNSGDNGKYNLNQISNGVQVKIFMPSNSEKRNVTIKYQLNDVIIKYNDVAELYWNFIGDGWNDALNNVNITINLPKESTEQLRIWGHGPLNGVSKIIDNKTVSLNIDKLASNTAVDARFIFDTNVLGSVKKNVSEDRLQSIIAKETNLANEANSKRQMYDNITKLAIVICGIIILNAIIMIVKYIKSRRKAMFDGDYYRELVEDYGPAIMNVAIGTNNYSYNMISTLLDLTRKGYIKIEKTISEGKSKKEDYQITLLMDKEAIGKEDKLQEFEKYFITDLMFYSENSFTMKEFKKMNEKNQAALIKSMTQWQKLIEERANEVEISDKTKAKFTKGEKTCITVAVLSTIISLIIAFMTNIDANSGIFIASLIINIFVFCIFGSMIIFERKYTEKGIEHREKWKAFKKFLLEFSNMKDYEVESMAIWEHYLVYAAGLGIADKVIKQLKIVYPNDFADGNMTMLNTYVIMSICSDTNSFNSFNSAFTTSSSAGGTGGGFSGSGGGGGGGRRRWWFLASILE